MKPNIKKLLILNAPYLLFVYQEHRKWCVFLAETSEKAIR